MFWPEKSIDMAQAITETLSISVFGKVFVLALGLRNAPRD